MADRIALVSCGKKKLDRPAPARHMYTSNLFRLSAEYAELAFDRWYIISAFHDLLKPDEVVEPYERSLAEMRKADRERWADRTAGALRREWGQHFTLLAGKVYAECLGGRLRLATHEAAGPSIRGSVAGVEDPLAGLGIGERLAWLKHAIESHPGGNA